MKKLLLQIMFMMLMLPAISQAAVYITGTITDSANNNPIPNHAVYILSDSSYGYIYYNTVYTGQNGVYSDTIPVPGGSSGVLYVYTFDCNNLLHQVNLPFNPATLNFTVDFQICNSTSPCQADFTYFPDSSDYLNIQFIDQSQGNPIAWYWNFGDPYSGANNGSNLQNPTHYFSSPGNYTVCLIIYGADSICIDTTCGEVIVGYNTGCQADFSYYISGYLTVQFNDYSTGGNGPWSWNFGDNGTSTLQNPSHSYSNPGQYLVTLAYGNPNDTCYDTKSMTIYLNDSTGGGCHAAFMVVADSVNNPPYTYHFIDQSTGNIISWAWNFGDGSPVSTLQNPIHIYPAPGYYAVCLTIQGADSTCYDYTCDTIIVGTGSGCQANFTYAINPAPENYTVDFTDLSTGNPTTWLWNFGGGYTSSLQNPSFTFPSIGTYPVCLTITGNNCTSTFCNEVVIQDTLNYHQIYGQVFEGSFPLEMGIAIIFSLDTLLNYNPYMDICNIDSMGIYYFTMVPDGNYLVYAIPLDYNGYLPTYYGDVLNWEQATVIELGEPNNPYDIHLVQSGYMTQGPGFVSGQINMGSIRSTMLDKMIMLLLDKDGNAISFVKVSESGSFDFSDMDYGIYYLHAEISGITSDNVQVVLTPEKPHADVVMTFIGKHILGIKNINPGLEAGVIYPNPATDKFSLALNLTEAVTLKVEIFNHRGQLNSSMIKVLGSGKTVLTVSVSDLSPGFYTLRVSSEKGINITRKLLITK